MAVLTSSGHRPTRLLGFTPSGGLPALRAALSAIPGPPVWTEASEHVVAWLQAEPHAPLIRRSRKALLEDLQTVQRRLETACQLGPFLPMDPAAATCPAGTATRLLAGAWPALAAALDRHGAMRQWDVVLRWSAEPVVAAHRAELADMMADAGRTGLAEAVAGVLRADRARREAALTTCLTPAVVAIAPPAGADTEVALTVLLPTGGEAAMEAALEALSGPATADASLDLRGPLPPISFFAVRLAHVARDAVANAWRLLDLPDRIDAAGLHQRWRHRAAAAHPDRIEPPGGETVSDVTAAYHTLRGLLPGSASTTLPDLLCGAGDRLIMPADATCAPEAAL